jgi:hypothetical protein
MRVQLNLPVGFNKWAEDSNHQKVSEPFMKKQAVINKELDVCLKIEDIESLISSYDEAIESTKPENDATKPFLEKGRTMPEEEQPMNLDNDSDSDLLSIEDEDLLDEEEEEEIILQPAGYLLDYSSQGSFDHYPEDINFEEEEEEKDPMTQNTQYMARRSFSTDNY